MNRKPAAALLGLALAAALATPTAHAQPGAADILDLSLEELMNVVVTSVAKRPQTLAQTAAAVHVISVDDIRRSGATNIPEALRLAPGVQVSALGNNKWAVSIRGFADRFSNKLLVLVDGRSVYTPLFSGVMWEALDVPLESVARIEVIRGPGASIWGSNAVNGVINIITHSPFDAQGSRLAVAAGSELRGHAYARHGWRPDDDSAATLHADLHDVDGARRVGGGDADDDWRQGSAGFAWERRLQQDRLRVQGGVSRSLAGDEALIVTEPPASFVVPGTQKVSTGHLLAQWERDAGDDRHDSVQFSLDQSDYAHVILTERRTTADLEYRQRRKPAPGNELTWGIGYRYSTDRIGNSALIATDDPTRASSLYSLFAQDEITLQPERWRLSLGARLEHNEYTGYVFQPNLRLLWTPSAQTSTWLSLARAVRSPSRIERGGSAYVLADPAGVPPFVPPSVVKLVSSQTGDELLDALDLGWRHQINHATSIDLAAFYYRYDKLRGAALTPPTLVLPAGYLLIETQNNNANTARQHGAEASIDWRPTPDWRLQAHYSWLHGLIKTAALPGQATSDYDGTAPTHQLSLRSSLDLPHGVRWDAWVRHVSPIRLYAIPAYTTLDMRLAWQANKELELSLVGQNLLEAAHPEYGTNLIRTTPAEIERGAYLQADWKF